MNQAYTTHEQNFGLSVWGVVTERALGPFFLHFLAKNPHHASPEKKEKNIRKCVINILFRFVSLLNKFYVLASC